jgi:hypothetical protein
MISLAAEDRVPDGRFKVYSAACLLHEVIFLVFLLQG